MGFRGEYDISKIALRILRWCSAFLVIVVVQPPLAADSSGCTQTHDLPVPGNSIDAVLGGGEFHCYRVPANHGGRLAVVIPQRGIVDVRLETPTGHVIDSPMHYAGDEWWLLGEEPAGHLRISSAAPYGASGTYMLNVERVGPKEMTIATRYSRAIHELRDVSRHPGLASEFFSISAEWKNTDRTQWAALAAHVAGFLWWQAGETDRAIEAFGNARALYRRSGDDANEAMLLNHHAMLALDINDFDAAVDLLDQARQIQQTRHYRHGLATTLNNHGLVRHYRGELDAARTFYLEAAELNAMLGRPQERLVQLNNLGGIHFVRGEAHAAEERFREAVHVAKQFKDDDKWTSALGNLGLVHMNSGAYLEALATYTQLLAVCRETGDARCGARTLGRIGQAYLRLGDPQRAIEYLQQADERRRALDDRRGRAQTLRHLAEAERRMGNFPEARRAIEEALKLESGPGQAGRAMLVVGWLFLDERNFDAARAAFLEAASRFEAAGEQHWSAVAKIRVAMATVLGGGRVDTDALRALRPSLQQGGLVDGEVELHYALALAAHAQGRLAQAMQALD
ncbi:MAG: tetratricopeptide repeat protein, partial [Proteobacteria bacterium]|nr:tetratricopeptide repeat protein [Pseudomonadota bacterium]